MVEKAQYKVVKKISKLEIRIYPELLLATVKGNYRNSFNLLFDYISGNNSSKKKISMTAPVITSEKIPMTAPVLSKKDYMAFVMPSSYDKSTIPTPKNSEVSLEIQKERKIAVLRFGGYTSDKKFKRRVLDVL